MTALDELEWELGGLPLRIHEDGGDDGLDDVAELEGESEDVMGDGEAAGWARLGPRPITLTVVIDATPTIDLTTREAAFAYSLQQIRKVMSPLPNRSETRLLRWRRRGEVAKQIAVRPAVGKPLVVKGDPRGRLQYDTAQAVLRLTAPDPVILSDELHEQEFTSAGTEIITNAGSFCAVLPGAWELESDVPVTITNSVYSESVHFPTAPVTVTRAREVVAPTYGLAYGPAGQIFPRWPLLRPGDNEITASAPCTFRWRDTW